MNLNNDDINYFIDNKIQETEKELKALKLKVEQSQLEYDILLKAAELIKKR